MKYIYICIHLNSKLGSVNISTTWNLLIHFFCWVSQKYRVKINKQELTTDCLWLLPFTSNHGYFAWNFTDGFIYIYISDLVKPRNNTREDDHIGPQNWSHRFIRAGCLLKFIVLQGISIKFYCAKYLLSLSIRNAISRKAFLSDPGKPPTDSENPFRSLLF